MPSAVSAALRLIRQILPGFAAVGIDPGDAPDDAAGAAGGDQFVAGDALVDGGGGDVLETNAGEVAVGFGAGDEVEAALVFDFLEEAVVDDGAVPHEDDVGALRGAAAQGSNGAQRRDPAVA